MFHSNENASPRDMTILSDLSRSGVTIRLTGDRLTLSGPHDAVARVTPLVREHRAALIASLTRAIPVHVHEALTRYGYPLTAWTPLACRDCLDHLRAEHPDFHVRGWSGVTVPPAWPGELRIAVQSIYVMSIQDHAPE